MKKYCGFQWIVICLLFLSQSIYGQGRRITGTVTEASTGNPIPGVNVVIENTTSGTVTDLDGNFSIQVPDENAVLVVSYVGYLTQRIQVVGKTQIDVQLAEDVQALEEVVVIGYGTQDARKVSSAISSVAAEDIDKIQAPSLDLALQGRSSGMNVSATSGEPGSMVRIRIRGNNSIAGDNSPLIVLDGYPLVDVQAPTGDLGAANNSPLSFLNTDDIESVEVLKDASATAIYGARGANGVLLITTKQGTAGVTQINFTAESFFSEQAQYPKMMSGPEYAQIGNELGFRDSINTDTTTTDWMELIQQPVWGQRYNLSLSGGNQANRFLVSGSYSDYKGVLIGSNFQRGTIRANLTNKLSKKLTMTTNLNYSQTLNKRVAGSDGTGQQTAGVIFQALRASPLLPPELAEEDPFANEYYTFPTNPFLQITGESDLQDQKVVIGNLTFDYQLLDVLNITLRGGSNVDISNRERYWDRTTGVGYQYNSRAMTLNNWATNYLVEAFATFTKDFGRHTVSVLGGYSYQLSYSKNTTNRVENILTDALGAYGMAFGTNVYTIPYNRTDREIQSFFMRANYDFNSKYLVSFSGRVDGSSVFTENNKYAFFPSGSAAWRVNEEPFMENIGFISELKLRVGYGETGNQAIQPYQSIPQFSVGNYVGAGNTEAPGVRPYVMGNSDLRWETTKQLNAGLDLQVFTGRIGLNVDYYVKTTRDLLLPFQLPGSAGYASITTNRGSLENRGLEITLSGEPVLSQNFSWRTNFNWSHNKSKVLDLGGLDYIPGPILDNNFFNENITGQWVGQPFSVFYGYIFSGLIQPEDFDEEGNIAIDPETGKPVFAPFGGVTTVGLWKVKDVNEDGIISADDRVYLGDPNPDFFFGWNNDISYKNFTLNLFIQGSYGGKIFNATRVYVGSGYTPINNSKDWYDHRWTPENPHNDPLYPRYAAHAQFKPNNVHVEDGSYVRLKNVSLRYNIPLQSINWIRSLEVYTTATNLLTFTNYSGMDPEVNLFGNRDDAIGVDFFAYPKVRTYTFGIRLGL